VPLEPEQREFVERTAAREDRTLAGQIRHFIAEVARRVQVEERTAWDGYARPNVCFAPIATGFTRCSELPRCANSD
jgi:hypothetical protein